MEVPAHADPPRRGPAKSHPRHRSFAVRAGGTDPAVPTEFVVRAVDVYNAALKAARLLNKGIRGLGVRRLDDHEGAARFQARHLRLNGAGGHWVGPAFSLTEVPGAVPDL